MSIKNIDQFIEEIVKFNTADPEYVYVYRGHSDNSFVLKPSIYRCPCLIEYEDRMYKELVTNKPDEFRDCKNTIEYLVKMQHYSLPTRLLDLTFNPLVALYFACEANSGCSGDVICFKIKKEAIKFYDSDTVSILSNTAKLPYDRSSYKIPPKIDSCPKKLISCIGCPQKSNYCKERCKEFYELDDNCDSIPYLQYEINSEKPHFSEKINPDSISSIVCIQAKLNNPRIINQAGLFLLFGIKENNKEMPELKESDWGVLHIEINFDAKKPILETLRKLHISNTSVYPEIDKFATEIKNNYQLLAQANKGTTP